MRGLGTVVNVITVLAGTGVGVLLHGRMPERVRTTVLDGIGLIVLGVGIASFLETRNAVFPVDAIVAGGRRSPDRPTDRSFVDGILVASLTFGIGAMMIVGSLQDGIAGDSELLIVKATLDGLVSVPFAAVYGWGVGFSVLSIAVLQGAITLLGATVGDSLLDDRMVAELGAAGGVMILGIGLRLLDLKKVKVGSYLPALAIAPALVAIFAT